MRTATTDQDSPSGFSRLTDSSPGSTTLLIPNTVIAEIKQRRISASMDAAAQLLAERERAKEEVFPAEDELDLDEEPEKGGKCWVQVFNKAIIEQVKANASAKGKDFERFGKKWLEAALRHDGCRQLPTIGNEVLKGIMSDLSQHFPNFKEATEFLQVELALSLALPPDKFRVAPILLHGAPGIGKTAFCRALAERLGQGFEKLSAGGLQGAFDISGTSSHWGNSYPGCVFNLLANGDAAASVLLIDEVDKLAITTQTPIIPALLDLLEPDSAREYRDEAVGIRFNASRLIIVTTANDMDSVPAPLKSRLHAIEVSTPTEEERRQIAQRMFDKVLSDLVWHRITVDSAAVQHLSATMVDLRVMTRAIRQTVGVAVMDGKRVIGKEDLVVPEDEPQKQRIGF